ncbi:universal stress protein [Halopenitus salinus]|jgi:nucleotide-binding universal stress UspA family protein|uniref:Universal stress protein n=1 Tax=Halopenitus salinus TaxID=1198295 RepID=A0ABD5UTS9_9EURY
MVLYDRILVPTDGSTEGRRAVRHALELAAVHGASVHALYVVNVSSYAGLPMETTWDGVDDLLRSDAETAVEEVESIAADYEVPVETAIVEGSPSREIIDFAEREDCDLVVMGTHGRGGIDRLLLGSVAEKVVRGSSVPVLTVRVDASEAAAEAETEVAPAGEETETTNAATGSEASGSS